MTFEVRLKKLLIWLKNIGRWLAIARDAWAALLVVAISLGVIFVFGSSEAAFRWTGMVLQLLGIGTVIWGIQETRMLFGKPSFFLAARQWLSSFPSYNGRTITASMEGNLPALTGEMHGTVSSKLDSDASVEERLAFLQNSIERLDQRIEQTEQRIEKVKQEHATALNNERQDRTKEVKSLRNKLEVAETGGLHISAMGALWLLVGVIMTSVPAELSDWVR